LYLCQKYQDIKIEMKFTERIKQLREERQMPQRQFAAALEIDTATYCKIEKGERRVKVEQVVVIAKLLKTDKDKLLALWLADQVTAVVEDEQKVVDKALNIAKRNIKNQ
jgi:transcriptional regulator with XRE-family HTH domain